MARTAKVSPTGRDKAMLRYTAVLLLCAAAMPASAAEWTRLIHGQSLDGWEVIGDGLWSVMRDGTILGQRAPKSVKQSWLYTRKDYRQYDLRLEYWTPHRGNSGVSIRDTSRARQACGAAWVADKTPSHIGYEIQIWMGPEEKGYFSGSVYLFDHAKGGAQVPNDWNQMEIESRDDRIRVKINGKVVSEHAGDPARSKTGPIGLQLHDPSSLVMFRNIEIREVR